MRIVGRLLALFLGGMAVAAAVAAVGAQRAKRDIVPIDDPEADEIRLAAIFEPISFRSTAASFRGGSIDCWFGGGMVDLRDATLDPAGAHLQVKAIFGGGQILVPASWRVVTSVDGLGGLGDSRPTDDQGPEGPVLTIDGVVMFGGFGVSTAMPADAERGLEQAVAAIAARRGVHPADEATASEPEPAAVQ